ncbi:MAG TPA: FAD-dependent monooxygenase [Hyphomicrobiales bacterium]|nr:FAD-dependent monooxygenase [Hyphomicrobiales bacterium]
MTSPRIAVVGAGIGGLAAAIALRGAGVAVDVFEQAPQFRRIGAAINLTPNAVKVLRLLGVADAVAERGYRLAYRSSRHWIDGAETSRLPLGPAAEQRYGAPQLTAHRADLLGALEAKLPAEAVHLGRRVTGLRQQGEAVELRFDRGEAYLADAVIGADGIHSVVREALFGPEAPRFTGTVAFRAIVSAAPLRRYDLAGFTKWWGPTPQSQLVTFLIDRGENLFLFATRAETDWQQESWSSAGDVADLRAAFAGYPDEARAIVGACDVALKTALFERDPLPAWTVGRVTLLGDACHPMMPFMAQGAAMGLEDAAVLARCLAGASPAGVPAALRRYEAARRPRTARIQLGSRENEWLRTGIDADWVYGYDAAAVPIE